MYTDDHSRYVLLTNHIQRDRNSWVRDKRTCILFAVLLLPVVIFCGTYMTLFGVFEKTVYPITQTLSVPTQALERAKQYSQQYQTLDPNRDYTFVNNAKNGADNFAYKLVCYLNYPGPETYALKAEKLDPFLCTHINIAFATITNGTLYLDQSQLVFIKQVLQLKEANAQLRVLLSVGGAGDGAFPRMLTNHTTRKQFIKSCVRAVKLYKIDGFDLDFEFPQGPKQRMHFTQLLEEFRASINRQEKPYLLSVAVAAPVVLIDTSYDISYMNEFVDYVNLMSYDYHFYTKLTPFTGVNAPLYAGLMDAPVFTSLNINYSANYWNYKGLDRNKLVVGLPTYGHSFKLTNPKNNGLYAPVSAYGKLGFNGFVDYSQICLFLTVNHISPVFDMDMKSPYAAKYLEWLSFDDEQSLSFKAEYIRDNRFGGAMIYSLNTDDHKGMCASTGKSSFRFFPLVNTVRQILTGQPSTL